MRLSMRPIVALVLATALTAADARSAEPMDPAIGRVRSAIGKSLPLLLKGAQGHVENRSCFACPKRGARGRPDSSP